MSKEIKPRTTHRKVPALKVHQWMEGWDKIKFSAKENRAKPEPHFYIFTLPAVELRSLCGISRRHASRVLARSADLGIQRQHEEERSDEIAQFVDYGYPWSTLSEAKRRSEEFNDLRKPGWLPTSIVINILKSGDIRGEKARVDADDLVEIESNSSNSSLSLPYEKWSTSWKPASVPPFEVIDGQHRLWAFDSSSNPDFELPVVAFHGLDISWQAYLFWTINIKPKRINPSLAFDLYPLLRAEDWLDRAEGHAIYRETRSQELTEALWSVEASPWYDRINMLGEKGNRWVTQSAWIKSLMATFIRPWHGRKGVPGGLFGSRVEGSDEVLGWSRAQQAAFLIHAWISLRDSIQKSKADWARKVVAHEEDADDVKDAPPLPFYGRHSLLMTDQGVRGFLHVLNDILFLNATKLQLRDWQVAQQKSASNTAAVTAALSTFEKQPAAKFVKALADIIADFDWRASSDPTITEEQRRQKLVFRGSSGYRELRTQLLEHLARDTNAVGQVAKRLV